VKVCGKWLIEFLEQNRGENGVFSVRFGADKSVQHNRCFIEQTKNQSGRFAPSAPFIFRIQILGNLLCCIDAIGHLVFQGVREAFRKSLP
jgi:hypothetical protein